ncbi:MAG: hybrid sensor histidine kinase/response regulator [Acidobacteria bacterium]|nr:hybrid sensor histidine kinase/response regulator [Acidobacteriota bacterium]
MTIFLETLAFLTNEHGSAIALEEPACSEKFLRAIWNRIMSDNHRKSISSRVPRQSERLLIVECKAGQARKLQQELASNGYLAASALGPEEAFQRLGEEKVSLILVVGARSLRSLRNLPEGTDSPSVVEDTDAYETCRVLRSDPKAKHVPISLVVPVWNAAALTRGLEAGAEYFLFTPYQEQDLLRSVRHALLNGHSPESAGGKPGVEVIYQDRMHTLSASRNRLAKLLLAIFEDFRQGRSSLSWCQAEVTELRRRFRQEQHRGEQVTSLQETVQGIAHDFGNLMETISAAVAVLEWESPKTAPYGLAMEAALAQAETLVATLRNVASLEKVLPLEVVDPGAVVQEAVEAALLPRRAPNVRARLRVKNLPPIRCNAPLLARCLNNLIWNAVQGMPSGGLLSIVGYVKNSYVLLEVSDTGHGIAEQDQEKIFHSRYTTKSGHAGLGLSLVRNWLSRMGGEITVASRPGKGTTFALSFPAARAVPDTEQMASKEKRSTPVQ